MANITGASIETFRGVNQSNVLRFRKMTILLAPETAPALTTIVNSAGTQLSIPDVYVPVGYLDKDAGAGLKPSISMSESTAYGEGQPIADYVESTDFTFSFTMKESHKVVFEAYYGLDLSAIQAKLTTKEITFDVPDLPDVKYFRALILGQHREGAHAIWGAQAVMRATLSDIGDQKYSDKDDFVYPVTMRGMVDSTLGTSRRPFFAGPGLADLGATPMGFTVATS